MEGFPFVCPIAVRFADIDAMNHVNNAVLVTFLETARVALWRERFGFAGAASSIPVIVARVAVDYRAPIELLDEVRIGLGVRSIGRSSFTIAYRVEASGRLAAEAETVQVMFDYSASKPVPIDGAMRARLEALRLPAAA